MKVTQTVHPSSGVWQQKEINYLPALECLIADGVEIGYHIDRQTLLTLLQGRSIEERISLYHVARVLLNAMKFIGLEQ